MNLETGLALAAIICGIFSFGFALRCATKLRNHRHLLEFTEKQIENLEDSLARHKDALDANLQRVSEQSRRIAWLETRIRQPKVSSEEILEDEMPGELPRLNITERRHRVMALAGRGQNAEMIATTLGMLPGEVELIINLNQVAQQR